MDQRLRLQAELRDNASPKIRQIGKELKEIRRTPGMEQAQKWFTGFSESAEGFVKDGGGISGVMGAIGVGGLTAAASLGELVKSLKELGDHTFQMKRLGQETGLTLDQVHRWEYVGQVFRVPVEQMDAALKTLGDQMVDFKRRRGELFGQLNQLDPKFAEKLQLENTQHQIQDILGWLAKIPDVAARNRWAKEFFGTEDVAALLTNGLPAVEKAIADANQNVSPITKQFQEQSDLLQNSIVDFNAAWTNFEVNVGPTVFAELKNATDHLKDTFDNIKDIYEWFQANKNKSTKDFIDDNAILAKDAAVAKAKEMGERSGVTASIAAGRAGQGEDGNALHRNDEIPAAPPKASSGGWFGGLFGGKLQKSAYIQGDDEFSQGGGGGVPAAGSASDMLEDGVKAGVLAAFREWAAESSAAGAGVAGGGGGGIQNASFETGLGGRGRGGGGGAGGSFDGKLYSGSKDSASVQEHAAFIRQAAAALGIDPNYALRVANSEGLHSFYGDRNTSFGDFQLHIKNNIPGLSLGGLGDSFKKETGLDPTNPHNWRAMDLYALKQAKKGGWGPWHGAAHVGIFGHAGMGLAPVGKLPDVNPDLKPLPNLDAVAGKAGADQSGRVDAHIHVTHDGRVSGASARSSGIVRNPQVHLNRGPTMTQPDYSA